jgi:hypothetical protein
MSAGGRGGIDKQALVEILAANGVNATPDDAEAALRALTRIHAAAASLLEPQAFDDTAERFGRLLENDGGTGAEA